MRIDSKTAALCLWPLAVLAQDPAPKPAPSFVRAAAEAIATAKPDRAVLDIGVVTQAQTAQTASAHNATQLDAAIREIRSAMGGAAELKTIGYSVRPEYRYPQGGGQPKITGYTATNVLEVTLNDVSLAGKVIDVATQSGANTVNGLRFTLKDESGVRTRALREAAANARAKTEAMAQALGLRIIRVLSAEETGTNVIRPLAGEMQTFARAAAAAPTPVESGTIEVRANVTVTVEVSP
jgi:uncharacterized protein